MREEFYEEEVIDRKMAQEMGHLTSGAAAHHAMQPDQLAMMHEEGGEANFLRSDRDRLREEIFTAVCEHTMAEGPHPVSMKMRIESVMRQFNRQVLYGMGQFAPWWDSQALDDVLRRYEEALRLRPKEDFMPFLMTVSEKIRAEKDQDFVKHSFRELCEFWVSDGPRWQSVIACNLVMVKALRPELLPIIGPGAGVDAVKMMSLEDLAVISGDAGKATVSARGKRIFSRKLEQSGAVGVYAHYQKSASAVESYRAAQKGNQNRRKKSA